MRKTKGLEILALATLATTLLTATPAVASIRISEQPKSTTARPNETVVLSCRAKSKNAKYLWYSSLDGGATWTRTNCRKRKISLSAAATRNGLTLRCKVRVGSERKFSKKAKVTTSRRLTTPVEIGGIVRVVRTYGDALTYVYAEGTRYGKAVNEAIAEINEKCGETFRRTNRFELADVVVTDYFGAGASETAPFMTSDVAAYLDEDATNMHAASTFRNEDEGKTIVATNLANTYVGHDAKGVMVHELGHCLGIDHVTGRRSVMNPTASMTTKMTKRDVAMFVERREAIGNAVRNAP